MTTEKFEQWCIIGLFGHQKLAGLVTEKNIGGAAFLQVDVPETKHSPSFTRRWSRKNSNCRRKLQANLSTTANMRAGSAMGLLKSIKARFFICGGFSPERPHFFTKHT
jgi:hypothetical protein